MTNLPILNAVKHITFIPKSWCETSLHYRWVYAIHHVLAITVSPKYYHDAM